MKQLRIACLASLLISCDGVYRTYELSPNLVFEGNTKHLTNEVHYGNNLSEELMIYGGIDLVLQSEQSVLIRQFNTREGYCTPKYRPVYDSLKRTKTTYIYWIIRLDSVPRQIHKDEHEERLNHFFFGPYDEQTAANEMSKLGAAARNMEIIYTYNVHYLPRWMNLVDTSYYRGGRKQRWWE